MNVDQLMLLVGKEIKRITEYVYNRLKNEWYPVIEEKDLPFVEREVKEVDKLFSDEKIYEIIKPQYERVLVQRHERHIGKVNRSMEQRQIPVLTFEECMTLILSDHFKGKDQYTVRVEPAIHFIVEERKNREERLDTLLKKADRRIGHFFRAISKNDALHIENLVKAANLKRTDDAIITEVSNLFEQYREKHQEALKVEINNSLIARGAEPIRFGEEFDLMEYIYDYEQSGTNVWDGTRGEHYAKYLINKRVKKDHPSLNIKEQGVLEDGVHKSIAVYDPNQTLTVKANPENWSDGPMLESADGDSPDVPLTEAKWSSPEGVPLHEYSRTISSYSGADAIVILNGTIIGEVQAIKWSEDFQSGDDPRVSGHVDVCIFEKDGFKDALVENLQNTKMCVVFCNEYGQRSWMNFIDPVFSDMDTEISVDMIIQTALYHFTAEDTKMERLDHLTPVQMEDGSMNPLFC